MKKKLILTATLLCTSLFNQARAYDGIGFWQDLIKDQLIILNSITSQPSALSTCADNNSSSECIDRYEKLYATSGTGNMIDGTLNINLGFGYADHAPYDLVHDKFSREALVESLRAPCQRGISACGFSQDPANMDRLVKTIQARGKPHRVEILLTSASLSNSNASNTSPQHITKQIEACRLATQTFMDRTAKGAEVVFYLGHSRNGGGPDFCPPRLLKNSHTDYPYYERETPGLLNLLNAMDYANQRTEEGYTPKTNQIIGLFSCNSTSKFYKQLKKKNPDAAFLLNKNAPTWENTFRAMYGSIDSILSQRCEGDFKKATSIGENLELKNMF